MDDGGIAEMRARAEQKLLLLAQDRSMTVVQDTICRERTQRRGSRKRLLDEDDPATTVSLDVTFSAIARTAQEEQALIIHEAEMALQS